VIGKVKLAGVPDHWRQSTWKKAIEIFNFFSYLGDGLKKCGSNKKI
jgi:hypothetical protein